MQEVETSSMRVPMQDTGTDQLVLVKKVGNATGAKGLG
jgi:hypothetical protein